MPDPQPLFPSDNRGVFYSNVDVAPRTSSLRQQVTNGDSHQTNSASLYETQKTRKSLFSEDSQPFERI